MASTCYRINSPHVVAETLDGEATIVDLESGTYYALNESGSLIWDELTRGTEPATVAQSFASTYRLEPDEASRIVDELTSQLTDQNLIVLAGEDSTNGSSPSVPAPTSGNGGGTYLPPKLSTYTDMQELLLLDPIHEVDESGWPSRR